MMRMNCFSIMGLALLLATAGWAQSAFPVLDGITFGEAASETGHGLVVEHSEVRAGGLGEPARRLLPVAAGDWAGGQVGFTLKVDPDHQNFATVRLWGGDASPDELVLFCEGKQVGYRHLGDIDLLDFGPEEAPFPGRFVYQTTPLPLALTKGRSVLHLEIRSAGPTWGYASSFEQYQKAMTVPTRGIYNFYTHTNGFFVPPTSEKEGLAPAAPPVRSAPGPEVLAELKARVNGEVGKCLGAKKPLNQMELEFLARAYFVKWTRAYQNPQAVVQVLKGLDHTFAAYRADPKLAEADPVTPNSDWFGLGPSGDAIRLLAGPLGPLLDQTIDDGGKPVTRRAAFAEMLVACRDWHRKNRRLYSNQTMINDLYGIYLANRGIEVVDPAKALGEPEVRRYLYESVALQPWRDSDRGEGSHVWGVGTNYWQLTPNGLTKELGYVGYYGEVLDWVTSIYEATRPGPGLPGDEPIKQQLAKIAHARSVFRYPGVDADGFRAMRIEAVVGWRDEGHYPGNVAYAERPTWDASPLFAVAASLDPEAVGFAQQMFADGQFFISLQRQMAQAGSLRVTAGLLNVPDEYDLIRAQPASAARLPMSPGTADFVFSDEVDGVVAIKRGDETLYASLYWRAHHAVNSLARVHYTTPQVDRIGVVQEEVVFEPSGMYFTWPDWINFGFGNGGPRYPVEMHSAHAGETLPIAKIPEGVKFHPGEESGYAGKGQFYTLRYGNYLIGMNLTPDKKFTLTVPAEAMAARDLVTAKQVSAGATVPVGPQSTAVVWWPNKAVDHE